MTSLSRLVHHCTWANQVWIDFLRREAAEDAYFASLMSHILFGEQAWFQRIRGEEVDGRVWRVMAPEEMQRVHEAHVGVYSDLLSNDLERLVAFRRFTGEESRASVSDILLHLCTHGMHHRGQMATHASSNGLEVPKSDFIHFCISRHDGGVNP